MAETGRSGFDLYCGNPGKDEEFWNTVLPVPGKQEFTDQPFDVKERKMRQFRLNFPLYNGVEELFIGLEKDAVIQAPLPLRSQQPIVIYGTSITQGGCASRHTLSYSLILSHKKQYSVLNIG